MDIIKTIFKLSFFLLGCVMLMLSLLVIPVGFQSFIFFFLFSVVFFGLSYKYTFIVIKWIYRKVRILLFKLKIIKKLEEPKKEKVVKKDRIKNTKKQPVDNERTTERKINWIQFNHENISLNKNLKQIKLNTKIYEFKQLEKIDLIVNSKKVSLKELKKIEKIKSIEIKVGTKIKKITYRHFKYNISKNNMKKVINNVSKDYKKLDKILKLNKKNIG